MNMKITCILAAAALLAGCASAPPPQEPAKPTIGSIVRLDPAFDALVSKDAQIEKVAGGWIDVSAKILSRVAFRHIALDCSA